MILTGFTDDFGSPQMGSSLSALLRNRRFHQRGSGTIEYKTNIYNTVPVYSEDFLFQTSLAINMIYEQFNFFADKHATAHCSDKHATACL